MSGYFLKQFLLHFIVRLGTSVLASCNRELIPRSAIVRLAHPAPGHIYPRGSVSPPLSSLPSLATQATSSQVGSNLV